MNMPRQNRDFDALALRMASLDDAAFDEFGREFGPRLWAYFARLGLSAADAESLAVTCVTEAAMKAVQYTPREEGSFAAWVYKLAYHQLMDWKRLNPQSVVLVSGQGLEGFPAPHSEKSDVAVSETNRAVFEAVHEALEQLPELDRRVVELRDFGGTYSYEEVAGILSISAGTARVRHHRAYKKLEQILTRYPAIQSWFGLAKPSTVLHEESEHVQ